jgi:formate hydrogenlyase subunit 3/multisubunit Na+/H+ antiporter MnhD subunit
LSPLLPLDLLLLGTIALLLGLLPRFRYTGPIAIGTALAALLAVAALGLRLPARATLSDWGPASLLPVGLGLDVDGLAWLFAIAVLTVTLATLLTGVARPGGRRIIVRAATLLLAFAGVAALFADNLIARIMAWAGLDLIYFATLVLLAQGEGLELQAVLNLGFNGAGTLLAVGAALMISRTSETLSLRDAVLTPESSLLITLAAVFRLGLFPLHLGLPAEADIRQGLGTLLRLIPAAVALEVMARLTVFGFAGPVRLWLTLFGVAAAVVGAAQLWNVEDPRLGLTYLVIAQSGLALLAGLWGGPLALRALAQQALTLLLGGALIYLSNGHDERRPWASGLAGLGALALLGAPLTTGFIGVSGLYSGAWSAGNWPLLVGVLVAQIFLAVGLLRAVFWPGQAMTEEPLRQVVYFGGLALLAAFVILAGVFSGWFNVVPGTPQLGLLGWTGTPSIVATAVVVVSILGGSLLWRFESVVRARAGVVSATLTSLFRLAWLYRLVWGLIHLAGTVVFNLAAVLEGEGAILWALAAALLVWLMFR